jgi:ionotropic glutamate receptor
MRLNDVFQIHGPQSSPITVRQLGEGPDYRPMLKEIQLMGESHIVLDVAPEKIVDILRQATEVKMMEEYQSYIVTNLDAHTIDFEELKFFRSNITSLRIIDPTSDQVLNAVNDWEHGERRNGKKFKMSPEHVPVRSMIIYPCLV